MNKRRLVGQLEVIADKRRYNHLSGVGRDTFLEAAARGLVERDTELAEGFKGILAITGAAPVAIAEVSPHIVVAKHRQQMLGTGSLAVRVAMSESYSFIRTWAEFHRTGRQPEHVDEEMYNFIPQRDSFIDEARKVAKDRSFEFNDHREVLAGWIGEWSTALSTTESTLLMVRTAVMDAELNPQFAPHSELLRQA